MEWTKGKVSGVTFSNIELEDIEQRLVGLYLSTDPPATCTDTALLFQIGR